MSFSQKRIKRTRQPNRMQRCLRLMEIMQHMKIEIPTSVAYQETRVLSPVSASVNLLSDFKTIQELREHLEDCKKNASPTAKKRCVICYKKDRQYVVAPCGHYKLCKSCVEKVTSCPICRTHIVHRIKVFE
ncbi:MAG: hypothetical protein CMO44_17985 [Verrucomicrobiales bacterium]|nr:hypothetical protein [Verrucomicrobiales bacterium]